MATAERTDPDLWEAVKAEVTAGDKGGNAGEWSARKAQMAVQEYKRRGGGYRGRKPKDNHLTQWTAEDWGARSGSRSRVTGERYLPRRAREALTVEEYRLTTAKKRADRRDGRQFSAQPHDIARKTAPFRHRDGEAAGAPTRGERTEPTRKDLVVAARSLGIAGVSGNTKGDLRSAIREAVNGAAGSRMRKGDLEKLARAVAAPVRRSMTKAELRSAISSA